MSQIDPRMEKILIGQGKMIFVNLVLAVSVGVFAGTELVGQDIFGFLTGMVISSVLVRVFSWITLAYLQHKYYGNDYASMLKDATGALDVIKNRSTEVETPLATKVMMTIVATPEQPFGKYMDHEFFEWLDVQGADDKVIRFVFKSTMDVSRGLSHEIPDGCILLPPGLLYQVEAPINTST